MGNGERRSWFVILLCANILVWLGLAFAVYRVYHPVYSDTEIGVKPIADSIFGKGN